jgi:hypothetical protein
VVADHDPTSVAAAISALRRRGDVELHVSLGTPEAFAQQLLRSSRAPLSTSGRTRSD